MAFLILGSRTYAADPSFRNNDAPVYVTSVPNPNDYTLFATNGWDGNWYIGYDTCWIKKLPVIPPGDYARAYLGARLGRMKVAANAKTIWDKRPVPGTIYIAVASTTAWKKENYVPLVTTEEIPLEGDSESAIEGTGESAWFWTEVPLSALSLKGGNYIALWSSSPELISVSSSPILAAAWGSRAQDTWLLRDIKGEPPAKVGPIGDGISYFDPALGLKLIPAGLPRPPKVRMVAWKNATGDRPRAVITAHVEGDSIEKVWLEYYSDAKSAWLRSGASLYHPPYIFSVDPTRLPQGRVSLRFVAINSWEDRTESTPFRVDVSTHSL